MKNEPSDWNKWELIYNGTEKGIEYLSQSQYEVFVDSVRCGDPQVVLKDGRVLPAWGARVHLNPEWVDPIEDAKIRKAIQKREAWIRQNFQHKYGRKPDDQE